MAHKHSVVDTDVHYKIDGVTRTIVNVDETKKTLVQYDHNSERLTFEVPRYIDGHDLLDCNVVQVHYVNSDVYEQKHSSDLYDVDDLRVKDMGTNKNVVLLSWLVHKNATMYVGSLTFVIRFACVTDDKIEYAWNTTAYKGLEILPGIFNSEQISEQNSDIIASLADKVAGLKKTNVLIVTVSNGNIASRTSDEIRNHVSNGGACILKTLDGVYNFVSSDNFMNMVQFMKIDPMDEDSLNYCSICDDSVSFYNYSLRSVDPPETGNVEQVLAIEAVDARGMPTKWKAIDLPEVEMAKNANITILAHTRFKTSDEIGHHSWDDGKGVFLFNIDEPLVVGRTYRVVVDGSPYSVVATDSVGWLYDAGVALVVPGIFKIVYMKVFSEDADGYFIDGILNTQFIPETWTGINSNGMPAFQSFTIAIDEKRDIVGKVLAVESVNDDGKVKLKPVNAMDGLDVIDEAYPLTHFETEYEAGHHSWDSMEELLTFNLDAPLVAGKTYQVTVDGVLYSVVAKNATESYWADTEVELIVDGEFVISYYEGLNEDGESVLGNYNASFSPATWTTTDEEGIAFQPVTIGIKGTGDIVGKLLAVKEVNEDGKATKFKTVDLPEFSECEAIAPLIVTVDSKNIPSHTEQEVRDHVATGGVCVLKHGNDIYNFVSWNGAYDMAMFILVTSHALNTVRYVILRSSKAYFHIKSIDNIEPPSTAQVGQLLMVDTVDNNNKPATWKATDLPSVEMKATHADGTTTTFKLYGEVMS